MSVQGGDKILLPPSAFDTLARLQVDYPMLFRLESSEKGTATHSGVLEFTAEEGSCYIPFWMMQNLLIGEGSVITVTNVSLPKATFVKLQPQHVDFLEITNPRAVLEHALRNFSCVTKGDVICIPFNSKNYHFELKEVQPQDAACIIETDCNVDFDAPLGYKEPERPNPSSGHDVRNNGGMVSNLANIPKQSAYSNASGDRGMNSLRNSACPSPALSSMSGAMGSIAAAKDETLENDPSLVVSGTRIVDGKIIRLGGPSSCLDNNGNNHNNSNGGGGGGGLVSGENTIMAERTGATGVQPNSAIAVQAPKVDYWAIHAGDGARLDGKKPGVLRDKDGNEVDVRKLRAEAAAARRLEMQNATAKNLPEATVGLTASGKTVSLEKEEDGEGSLKSSAAPISKRKSRIGSKYSKIKGAAMGGGAETSNKKL
jgi:ubiquitin fusion degradation protein 1